MAKELNDHRCQLAECARNAEAKRPACVGWIIIDRELAPLGLQSLTCKQVAESMVER
jgi:hypothetical protein